MCVPWWTQGHFCKLCRVSHPRQISRSFMKKCRSVFVLTYSKIVMDIKIPWSILWYLNKKWGDSRWFTLVRIVNGPLTIFKLAEIWLWLFNWKKIDLSLFKNFHFQAFNWLKFIYKINWRFWLKGIPAPNLTNSRSNINQTGL